ncbi:MAG: type II toxin-antitoxin system VapC family toxin [Gammaproteobacteria bacterium]|nr:type II toxin-antitoxin system VapC family toxin [Gammaproteobacteria bacterium]MCP5444976.1 type II toxin-antitoxin system VapC family toxin [Chromatiaceae bacterium]
MYILDTNTLIYFFKGIGNVADRLLAVSPKEIGIPAVVLYELEYGIAKSTSPRKRMAQLKALCDLVEILSFGEEEAKHSASVRASLEKRGTPIGPYDVMIAGTALSRQGILVTSNTKEFKRIPKLKTVDWL